MPAKLDGELNPNHRTTQSVSGHWHKYLALVMWKMDHLHVVISPEDVQAFLESGIGAVTIKDGEDGDQCIHLRLVTYAEGECLAREEGGLPA